MTFSFDFSQDKPDIRALIPRGTKVLVRMNYTPGGADFPDTPPAERRGQLTKSKEGDSLYLKAEFTVLRGPYKGRKFWSNMTIAGGKLDENGRSKGGNISRQNIRLILDSGQGLSSRDDSPQAAAKRVLPNGFADLQGRQFVCKVSIEEDKTGKYPDRNSLGQILTIDHKDFPKSEAELDAPPAGAPPAALPMVAAPSWGAPETAAPTTSAATTDPGAGAAAAGPFGSSPAAAATPSTATPDPATDNNIPAWMRAA